MESTTETIAAVARLCLDLFDKCLSKCTGDEESLATLEHQQRRFQTWTSSLNVFAARISLDAQLHRSGSQEIRDMVLLLLDVLNENLSLAQDLIVSGKEPSHDSDYLKVPNFGIEGSLDRLERVAAAVLDASEASLNNRVAAYAARKRDLELERLVWLVILTRFPNVVPPSGRQELQIFASSSGASDDADWTDEARLMNERFQMLLQSDSFAGLFRALFKTTVFRHYRMLYERERRWKDRKKSEASLERAASPETNEPEKNSPEATQPVIVLPERPVLGFPAAQPTPSMTVTTLPHTIDQVRFRSQIEHAEPPEVPDADVDNVSESGPGDYPRPPRLPEGVESAICSLCGELCPADVFEGERWISHVSRDVKPYVCIAEDCIDSPQFFARSRDWKQHMRRIHTAQWIRSLHNTLTWKCSVCHHVGPTNYVSETAMQRGLARHMQQKHHDFKEDERQALVHISGAGIPIPRPVDRCPVCGDDHKPRPSKDITDNDSPGVISNRKGRSGEKKQAIRFADSDSESDIESSVHGSQGQMIDPDLQPSDHDRIEKHIGQHLRTLALHFASRLVRDGDGDEDSDLPHDSDAELGILDLESLPKDYSEDDTPELSGVLQNLHNGPDTEDAREQAACVEQNMHHLLNDWKDVRRHPEPPMSPEKSQDIWPILPPVEDDTMWEPLGIDSALTLTAYLLNIVDSLREMSRSDRETPRSLNPQSRTSLNLARTLMVFQEDFLDKPTSQADFVKILGGWVSKVLSILNTDHYLSYIDEIKLNDVAHSIRFRVALAHLDGVLDNYAAEYSEVPDRTPILRYMGAILDPDSSIWHISGSGDAMTLLGSDIIGPNTAGLITPNKPDLPCHIIPLSRDANFVGREGIIHSLRNFVNSKWNSSTACCTLSGSPGIGKTAIVNELVHIVQDLFHTLLWFTADTAANFATGLRIAGRRLGIVSEADDLDQTRRIVLNWLAIQSNQTSLLLVFDGVNDYETIRDFIPVDGSPRTLVTCRNSATMLGLGQVLTLIDVGLLALDEGVSLLLRVTGRDPDQENVDQMRDAVRVLGFYPGAIVHVGNTLRARDFSFEEFLRIYSVDDGKRGMLGSAAFIKPISQSLYDLRHSRELLGVMSLLNPEEIPEIILENYSAVTGWNGYPQNHSAFKEAREELLSWSLIQRQQDDSILSFYSCAIQDAIRLQLQSDVFQLAYLGAWKMIKAEFPRVVTPWFTRARDCSRVSGIWCHILSLLKYQGRFKSTSNNWNIKDLTTIMGLTCDILMSGMAGSRFSALPDVISFHFLLQDYCITKLPSDDLGPAKVNFLYCRGMLGLYINNHSQAFDDLQACFATFDATHRELFGGSIAMYHKLALTGLGCAYLTKGDYQNGIAVLKHALEEFLHDDGPTAEVTFTQICLGFAYLHLERYYEACDMFEAAQTTSSMSESQLLELVYLGWGNALAAQGRMDESFEQHRLSLRQTKLNLGHLHHRTADAWVKVSEHLTRTGELNEALYMLSRAVSVYKMDVYHKPEASRVYYKTGKILQRMKQEKMSVQDINIDKTAGWEFNEALRLYNESALPENRASSIDELTDRDFDQKIIFWSR